MHSFLLLYNPVIIAPPPLFWYMDYLPHFALKPLILLSILQETENGKSAEINGV